MGHHFIPQRYLRNFEVPTKPGFVWLHDKRAENPKLVKIAEVAQSRKFYSENTERELAHVVEPAGNAVIRKLTSGTAITLAERFKFAYYIAVMMRRVPAQRRKATALLPSVLPTVMAEVREELRSMATRLQAAPELLAKRLNEVDFWEKQFARKTPDPVLQQIRDPWPGRRVVEALFNMSWRVITCPEPQYFVTTDNPVFFFTGYGLANSASEVSFPLSTTHALHCSWQGAPCGLIFQRVSPQIVKETNRRLISEAERLAFYHEPAPWLFKLFRKHAPYLSSIVWLKDRSSTNIPR